ncbi:MAG TPA: peptidyl-prolyl cis-trans isomerase [Xanthobacteraceae bacterium]|jgi:peptidyl-prolyl cis-trans isomerase D|nr:peptidyl-prolyl cis-trans isomerase [Xanthobacteraceae bacterium]
MLRGIHKASTNWFGKIIMALVFGVLTISFGLWGIADIFTGFGRSSLAKVGKTEIGIEQFRQIYNDRLRTIGQQLGKPISPDDARTRGIDRVILAQVIAETALDERARQLRLAVPNDTVADLIRKDPNFRGPSGTFDRNTFDLVIRNAGFTEQRYVQQQREVILRKQILDSVTGGIDTPNAMLDIVEHYQNEERAIDYVMLGTAQAGDVPQPTPEELAKYFGERKALFRAPEYRKIYLLPLSPDDIAKTITVSDEDAKKIYEQRKSRYVTPEKRHIEQIVFPNADDAKAASDKLKSGTSFADLVKERGLKPDDVDLGTITKASIVDSTIANAAFSLPEGQSSEPIKGGFGTVILHVDKIEPGTSKPLDQAYAEIKHDVAIEKARGQLSSLRDKLEDLRAGGATLEEASKQLKLNGQMIEAVDRSGRVPSGLPAPGLPKGVDVIGPAFATEVGVENEPVQLPGGGYLYYDTVGITPSHDRSLDEVKDEVTARWTDDQIAERLSKKSKEMVDKLNAGTSLADVAAAENVKPANLFGLKRGRTLPPVQPTMLQGIFATPKGKAGAATGENGERIVFVVTDVTVPKSDPNSAQLKQAKEALKGAYSDDMIAAYVTKIEDDVGVTINNAALDQIVGRTTNQ